MSESTNNASVQVCMVSNILVLMSAVDANNAHYVPKYSEEKTFMVYMYSKTILQHSQYHILFKTQDVAIIYIKLNV